MLYNGDEHKVVQSEEEEKALLAKWHPVEQEQVISEALEKAAEEVIQEDTETVEKTHGRHVSHGHKGRK